MHKERRSIPIIVIYRNGSNPFQYIKPAVRCSPFDNLSLDGLLPSLATHGIRNQVLSRLVMLKRMTPVTVKYRCAE
jgi:hypothetical protein